MAIWGENSGLTPATRTEIVGVGVTGPLPASALREVVGVMCGCGFALNFISGPMFQARSSMLRCDPSVLRFKVCLFRAPVSGHIGPRIQPSPLAQLGAAAIAGGDIRLRTSVKRR